MRDFVVVGAGPAGARFARSTAERGHDVLVLEQGRVGEPLACSGHVSLDLWEYAESNGIDIELRQVNEYASVLNTAAGLSDSQREALRVAFDAGYFEEPRDVTLGEVATQLDISQPAASGLLRRAIRRLVVSSLGDRE